MDINTFWELIEYGCHSDEPEEVLKNKLAALTPDELISFQEHFDRRFDAADTWDLWGAAYLIGGGCSDDGFIDFRYGLISKGRDIYQKAITNPDSLATLGDDIEIENEMFGYVASSLYEQKTSKEMPDTPSADQSDTLGTEWDFDDESENLKRLPLLSALYQ